VRVCILISGLACVVGVRLRWSRGDSVLCDIDFHTEYWSRRRSHACDQSHCSSPSSSETISPMLALEYAIDDGRHGFDLWLRWQRGLQIRRRLWSSKASLSTFVSYVYWCLITAIVFIITTWDLLTDGVEMWSFCETKINKAVAFWCDVSIVCDWPNIARVGCFLDPSRCGPLLWLSRPPFPAFNFLKCFL
jgi:hypothetical protein